MNILVSPKRPVEVCNAYLWPVVRRSGRSALTVARRERSIITLACLALFWAISISFLLFPYYSNDHDEPVYVLQAKMLLEGNLYLQTDEFTRFFRPFFFADDGDKLFSKYTPVHAAILALGELLFGSMRASLGLVAALNVIVFYLFSSELYPDRRFALKAATVLLLSPFFLIQSATFLPYATSLMFCLTFAFLFLRGVRTDSQACLALSGVSLGIAFFHRPYDALLFAIPFGLVFLKLHWPNFIRLIHVSAQVSLGFIPFLGLTLAYNAFMTGDPILFAYTFHEPMDKLGFGLRRLHAENTPVEFGLLESIQGLWANVIELNFWIFGGPILMATAVARLAIQPFHWQESLLLLLLLTYPLGYLFFWGPYNIGPLWGAIDYLGPFYFFPMLAPITLLGTQGILRLHARNRQVLVLLLVVMVATDLWLMVQHVSRNYEYTEENRAIYEPFGRQGIHDTLVFVPPIYGNFLLHPFAYLQNDPLLDGQVVYALDRGKENFELMDRYPERVPYRFVYRGEITEEPDDVFSTDLVNVQVTMTNEFNQNLRITNTTDKPYVFAYVWNDGNTETYLLDDDSNKGSEYSVGWTVTRRGVTFDGSYLAKSQSDIASISDTQPLAFAVAFSDTPDRASQMIYERRFYIRFSQENMIEVMTPSEEWHNPDWPSGKWTRGEIIHVIGNSIVSSREPLRMKASLSDNALNP